MEVARPSTFGNPLLRDYLLDNTYDEMFTEDRARSNAIDPARWAERPFGERLHEWTAQWLDVFL